jgi:hypothetical protein
VVGVALATKAQLKFANASFKFFLALCSYLSKKVRVLKIFGRRKNFSSISLRAFEKIAAGTC